MTLSEARLPFPAAADSPAPPSLRPTVLALGATLALLVLILGAPIADAPWLAGDEHIFIVDNHAVTGVDLGPTAVGQRLAMIFEFPPKEDLYQPLPILTYALQWTLAGDSPLFFRITDVLLHAANALLLWAVLFALLRRIQPAPEPRLLLVLTWGLALLWGVHPILVSAWTADMGRTHLMAATFALLALLMHVRSIERERPALFAAAALCLFAAMLSKVLVGWLLLAAVLELWLVGWRKMLRSPRIYIIAAICALFGAAAVYTGRRVGLIQDASAGLMGDPISRSAMALWLYTRNLLAPFWLSPWWYVPDPLTNWSNPRVWVGLALALAAFAHAGLAWRRPNRRHITVGWAWFWAALLPVIGLVGARESAAADRYMYVPLMGLTLVAGAIAIAALPTRYAALLRPRSIAIAVGVVGAVLLLLNQPLVRICRRPIARGQRVAELHPGNPRALESLASEYCFARNHPLPADDLALVPAGRTQFDYFASQRLLTLRQAARTPNIAYYFPGPIVEAAFHRRISAMFADERSYPDALEEAQVALRLDPDSYSVWVRLAIAYAGVGQPEQARQAFERCEQLLPPDPLSQATHYSNYGCLLLFELDRADLAFPKFRQVAALLATLPPRYQRQFAIADIGLARCEIRLGIGERGYELIMRVLNSDPQNALAGLVLAEYHLRSEHWPQAADIYGQLIQAYPAAYVNFGYYYEALRGYQWVCIRTNSLRDAALMWDHAATKVPGNRELNSFRAWSLALAGEPGAEPAIVDLLAQEPDNQLGCLARAILAVRAGDIATAVASVDQARTSKPVPEARGFERTLWAIERLRATAEWPPETAILEAALNMANGSPIAAEQQLRDYAESHPDSPSLALADRIRTWSEKAAETQNSEKIGR